MRRSPHSVWGRPARQGRKGPGKRRPARKEMIRIDDELGTMGAFVVNSFHFGIMKMRRDERRSPMRLPFISFRLLSEGGLGAPGTEVQGFAGYCAPSPDRRSVENPSGLGAKGTEVQGFAGYRAPSPGRRLTENSPGLGANGTEMQGFAGFHAPSPCRLPAENSAVLIELSVFQTYNPICLEI